MRIPGSNRSGSHYNWAATGDIDFFFHNLKREVRKISSDYVTPVYSVLFYVLPHFVAEKKGRKKDRRGKGMTTVDQK